MPAPSKTANIHDVAWMQREIGPFANAFQLDLVFAALFSGCRSAGIEFPHYEAPMALLLDKRIEQRIKAFNREEPVCFIKKVEPRFAVEMAVAVFIKLFSLRNRDASVKRRKILGGDVERRVFSAA